MKNKKTLSPTTDIVFQHLFGEVGSEKITGRFLELILEENISKIDLSKNPILRRKHINDKLGVLDVVAHFNNDEICNIEIQCYPQDKVMERILNYWGRTYSAQMKKGDDYDALHRTISILITTEPLKGLENLPYHTSWKIIEEKFRRTILTDKLEIDIIELYKIKDLQDVDSELLDWLFFIEDPKCDRVVEKMKKNKLLQEANDKLNKLSEDEYMQKITELREKAIWDRNTAVNSGFRRGREKRFRRTV